MGHLRFEQTSDSVKVCVGILAACICTCGMAADFAFLPCNRPDGTEWLKVSLGASPAVVDYDGDGDLDLVASSGWQTPRAGTYFFENTGILGDDGLPIFRRGRRISDQWSSIGFSHRKDGSLVAFCRDRVNVDFRRSGMEGFAPLKGLPEKVHEGKNLRLRKWRLVDYDGDGREDLLYAVGDWSDYGDMWAGNYAADGSWTGGALKSRIYWLRNEGASIEDGKWAAPQMVVLEDGSPLDTYGNPSNALADFDGDGDLDFLVTDFVDGFHYFENVGTRTKPKWSRGRFPVTPDGKALRATLCIPCISEVDFNGDGRPDFVSGEEDGRVALYLNTGETRDGVPVFEPAKFFRQEAEYVALGVLSTPHAFDWDGDGDEDILAGDSAGHIAFIENLSGRGVADPSWAEPVLLSAGVGKNALPSLDNGGVVSLDPIVVQAGENGSIQGPSERKWGYTTLSTADWDGDGLPDVMVNTIWGKVLLFPNVGTRTAPKLGAPRGVEVEWEGPQPRMGWGWIRPELQSNPRELVTQWRTTPYMIDLNRDGLMDLVMLDTEGFLAFYERAIDPANPSRRILKAPRRAFMNDQGRPVARVGGKGGHSGRLQFCFADWDGDGKDDFIRYGGRNVAIFRQTGFSDGKWHFEAMPPVSDTMLNSHGPKPCACDFDADGRPDLLVGAEDGFIYRIRNYRIQRKDGNP